MEIDKQKVMEMIKEFRKLDIVDPRLTQSILESLGLLEIIDLQFALNKSVKRERDAAMDMIEKYLPKLLSGNLLEYGQAKLELKHIYYDVESPSEDA